MRLIYPGLIVLVTAGSVSAQGNWQPQASPSPTPPVYVVPPAPPPPAPRPPTGKERPARPIGDPGTWVTNDDYPEDAATANEHGTTAFRLTIDSAGKITGCQITASSGSDRLDQAACRLVTERATFTPALDRKGKPITSTWASRFRWVLPKPELMPVPKPFVDTISFIIETDGTATGCVHSGPGPLTKVASPCGNGQVFEPPRDAAGNPVRRKVTAKVSFEVTDPDAPPPAAAPATAPPVQPRQRKQP